MLIICLLLSFQFAKCFRSISSLYSLKSNIAHTWCFNMISNQLRFLHVISEKFQIACYLLQQTERQFHYLSFKKHCTPRTFIIIPHKICTYCFILMLAQSLSSQTVNLCSINRSGSSPAKTTKLSVQ